jgi:hypothetical protein
MKVGTNFSWVHSELDHMFHPQNSLSDANTHGTFIRASTTTFSWEGREGLHLAK